MKRLKQNLVIITLIPVLICFYISASFLVLQIKSFDLQLKDVYGNRAYLDDIHISGILTDEFHKLEFNIKHGKISADFSSATKKELEQYYYVDPDNRPISCRIEFRPSEDANIREGKQDNGYTIHANKVDVIYRILVDRKEAFSFETDMCYKTRESSFRFSYNKKTGLNSSGFSNVDTGARSISSNPFRINKYTGRTYVFIATGRDSKGYSGAYDITSLLESPTTKKGEQSALQNIAPLDLKDGKVRVLGMEATGNTLLFITIEKDDIVLRPFDLKQNRFLDEINIGNKIVSEQRQVTEDIRYSGQISNQYICLAFPTAEGLLFTAVYDAEENCVVLTYNDDTQKQNAWLHNIVMKYKNNRLFLLRKYWILGYNTSDSHEELIISVMEGKELLYEGFLSSGVNDDHRFTGTGSVLQGRLYFRSYFALELE